jgi:uncharacterized membrane protein
METEHLSQELSDQDRVLLVFGYLGPLALVSLVASRREFVKWHAKQGLALSVTLLAVYPLLRWLHLGLDRVENAWLSGVAEVIWAMDWLIVIGVVVAGLVCIVRALEGERFKLPGLGDLADRL